MTVTKSKVKWTIGGDKDVEEFESKLHLYAGRCVE